MLSAQHDERVSQKDLHDALLSGVIRAVIPPQMWTPRTRVLINPTGRFVLGGPAGDTGLTGRKIIVDTYGGYARHGGGAFSGKDPSKVDRSACYAARYVAKNLVAARLATRCEVALAYAIGVAQPVSVQVNTFGTGRLDDERLGRGNPRALRPQSRRHHPRPGPAPSPLPAHRRLRAFRPHRPGFALGAHRPRG